MVHFGTEKRLKASKRFWKELMKSVHLRLYGTF